MTAPDPVIRISEPRHAGFRVVMLVLAALLGAQCIWLLLAEFSRTGVDSLPTNADAAAAAAKQRDAALWAASIGAVRGDLWAESAFTYASLLFDQHAAVPNADLISTAAPARLSLDHALAQSPHRSDVWLLFAGMALRLPSQGIDPIEALKMSYYTGPSERDLIPLRLRLATIADRFDDVQMREFANRELRALLKAKQNSSIVEAYNTASAAGRLFIEQTVGDLDPSFLKTLRTGNAQKHAFPN